jgi:hypothetical protein
METDGDAFISAKREANSKAVKMLKRQGSDVAFQTKLVLFGVEGAPEIVANAG